MKIDLRKIPAVYMNLSQDLKKKNQMESLLTKCEFQNIIRVEGSYRPHNPPSGCAAAHYNGLCEIDPPFVLFEDDCILMDVYKPVIEVSDDSDAVCIGTSQWATYLGVFSLLLPICKGYWSQRWSLRTYINTYLDIKIHHVKWCKIIQTNWYK